MEISNFYKGTDNVTIHAIEQILLNLKHYL